MITAILLAAAAGFGWYARGRWGDIVSAFIARLSKL